MKFTSRVLIVVLVVGLLGTGAGAILAATGGSSSDGNSAAAQYCPPSSFPIKPSGCQTPTTASKVQASASSQPAQPVTASHQPAHKIPKGAKAQCRQVNRYHKLKTKGARLSLWQVTQVKLLKKSLTKHGYVCGSRHGRTVLRKIA
jgi:hypothetical protein